MRKPRAGEEGFTLIEVLVAFVVSALLLVVVFDGMTVARARDRAVRDKSAALVLANELLSARLAGELVPVEGTSGPRLSWVIREEVLNRDPRGGHELRSIVAEIKGPKAQTLVRLEGRKLVSVAS